MQRRSLGRERIPLQQHQRQPQREHGNPLDRPARHLSPHHDLCGPPPFRTTEVPNETLLPRANALPCTRRVQPSLRERATRHRRTALGRFSPTCTTTHDGRRGRLRKRVHPLNLRRFRSTPGCPGSVLQGSRRRPGPTVRASVDPRPRDVHVLPRLESVLAPGEPLVRELRGASDLHQAQAGRGK